MKTIKLFRVIVDGLFADDIKNEETYTNFPVDYNSQDTYFDWSGHLLQKAEEYNKIEIDWESVGDSMMAEKRLVFCEVSEDWFLDWSKKQIEDGIRDEAINYKVDYDWKEIQYELLYSPEYDDFMAAISEEIENEQ